MIDCAQGDVDGCCVGSAANSNIARLQAAGTGKHHLPSNAAGEMSGLFVELIGSSRKGAVEGWQMERKVVVTTEGSDVFFACTWIPRTDPMIII